MDKITAEQLLENHSIGISAGEYAIDCYKAHKCMEIYALQARIQERRDCIYLLETARMDDESEDPRKLPPDYLLCIKDEIECHQDAIQDLEKELLTLTSPT